MTDHSTARALVKRLRAPAYWMSGSSEGHEGENDAPREAADFIEQALTPPEGDTLSDELRFVEIVSSLTGEGLGEYRVFQGDECLGDVSSKRLAAALQSRVSPQEGLREALEEACGALSRIEKAPAWGAPERWETTPAEVRWLARDTLAKIDAALSASRMSDL